MKPSLRFLLSDPAHFVALGFGSGLWPKGPGTAGTLAGWLLYPLVSASLSDGLFGGLLLAFSNASSFSFESPFIWVPLALGALFLVLFVRRQKRLEQPLIDLRPLSVR